MRFTAIHTLFFAGLIAAAPQTQDPQLDFYASLYEDVSDCSGGTSRAFTASMGNCINKAIPMGGSARVNVNQKTGTYMLGGWTEANCTGKVVMLELNYGNCMELPADVASWSSDDSPLA